MNAAIIAAAPETALEEQVFSENLFSQWVRYIDAMPRTVDTYTKAIKQFWKYLESIGATRAPRAEDVMSFREYLKETKKPTTVQAYMTAVKIFFKWTAKQGLYPNIAEGIKGARLDREHKKDYLTSSQERRLIESIDRSTLAGKRDYAILALMLTTGLRTISVIRADIGDIRALGDREVMFYQGKGHEEKAVYVKLAEPVEEAIREYLQARGETDPKAPLFASVAHQNNGGRMTTQSISRIAKTALRAIGLDSDRLTAHSLRHTAATQNLMNGGTLEETQQLLDHTNISTTMIYAHDLERMNNNSEDRLAGVLFS